MKRRRWPLYVVGAITLCCSLFCVFVIIPTLQNVSVYVESSNSIQKICPVGQERTDYRLTVYQQDIISFDCNTADLQEAKATLGDGTTLSFFLEYDGDFVAWQVPDGYTCISDWNGGGSITTSGTDAVQDHPDTVGAICKDDSGNSLFLIGHLPLPPLPSQSG